MGRKATQATKVSTAIKKMAKKLIKWKKLLSGLRTGVAVADCLNACFASFVVVLGEKNSCYMKLLSL